MDKDDAKMFVALSELLLQISRKQDCLSELTVAHIRSNHAFLKRVVMAARGGDSETLSDLERGLCRERSGKQAGVPRYGHAGGERPRAV